MASRELKVEILGDATSALATFQKLSSSAEETGDKVDKGLGDRFSSAGEKMKSAGTKLSLFATAPLALLGHAAIGAASDMNESISKVNVLFGKSGPVIQEWSKTTAQSLGISRQSALEFVGTFGNLFTAMGMAQDKSADMSQSLVKLSADLASFNNADPTEVLEALRSGLVGETEPLRRFGIQLSAARVEQEGLRLGLVKEVKDAPEVIRAKLALESATIKAAEATKKHGAASLEARMAQSSLTMATEAVDKALEKSGGSMNDAQKAQAVYSLILKDTTTAQGDFARTADGLANQQRIQAATTSDLSASFGSKLLPIQLKVQGVVSDLAGRFSNLSGTQQNAILITAGLVAALGPVVTFVGAAASAVTGLSAAFTFLAANPIVLVIGALVLLGVAFVVLYKNSETFRDIVNGVFNAVKNTAVTAVNFIKDNWQTMFVVLTGPFGLAAIAIARHWDDIVGLGRRAVGLIVDTVSGVAGIIVAPFRTAFNAIARSWNNSVGALSFSVPSWVPGIGGNGFHVPNIPMLAAGGIVTKPTLAMIGEAGPEAVVPLSRGGFGTTGTPVTINIPPGRGVIPLDELRAALYALNRLDGPLALTVR